MIDAYGRLYRRRYGSTLGTVIAALASVASIANPIEPIRYPHRSPMDALRGDVVRIGRDMKVVIERHDAKLKAAKKSAAG